MVEIVSVSERLVRGSKKKVWRIHCLNVKKCLWTDNHALIPELSKRILTFSQGRV